MLERFDANKNGQLEAAELPERMQEHIGDIDTSGDGVVSKDELAAHFKARAAEHQAKFAERAKERFDKKDANHDGMLDQSRSRRALGQAQRRPTPTATRSSRPTS